MIISAHIAELGPAKALATLRKRPAPELVDGLRYAETWLTTPLRTGLLPETEVTGAALIAAWDDDDALDRFLDHPTLKPYQHGWHARFEPVRSVGAWPAIPDLPRQEQPIEDGHPVGVLTMARMRYNRMGAFALTAAAPEREAVLHPAFIEGCALMRPPTLIATFSLWRSVREMREYTVGAYPGGHVDAMRKHGARPFHHETVFVRLKPYSVFGQWRGRSPISIPKELATV